MFTFTRRVASGERFTMGYFSHLYSGRRQAEKIRNSVCPNCKGKIKEQGEHFEGYSWETRKKFYKCKKIEEAAE